jgi:ribosome-associated translation inhibitor RaiA
MLPVDVLFRNMLRSDAVEARIREKAETLPLFDPRLQHCRVIVDLPHRHHAHGNRFRVRIELKVPRGKDLIVDHGPAADVHQAVHDAFEAAARRLKADAQRRRGAVKTRARRDGEADFGTADLWH